jgi:hypothetical protein
MVLWGTLTPRHPQPLIGLGDQNSISSLHVSAWCFAGQLYAQLLEVRNLLGKVSAMGPLVSLLKANIVREEFLRTNRDLLDTFGILARGEQLLVS